MEFKDWMEQSNRVPSVMWHVSNYKFDKFDLNNAGQQILWFAKDRDDLLSHHGGASIRKSMPLYLYKVSTTVSNPASWEEYDKYMLNQIEQMGYDSMDLGDDFVVFNPNDVKILDVEMIRK